MLKYILDRVASELGIPSPELNAEQKVGLLNIINEAADEIYSDKDLPVCLEEVYLKATSNKELALPYFVGELRAIRSTLWNQRWTLQDMRPRYNSIDWPNINKVWRHKGYSPIKIDITNAAPGTIDYPATDTDLEITLVGITADSNRAIDKVFQSATSVNWTKSFIDFIAIRKNKVSDFNVTLRDADGVEIAILYADQLESRYVIVDVSQFPDLTCCPDGTYVMEVLYKPRLQRLELDDDTFPVDGFDDVIVVKSKQLYYEGQENKEEKILALHTKSQWKMNRKIEDRTGTIQKKMRFQRNRKFGIFRRYSGDYSHYTNNC